MKQYRDLDGAERERAREVALTALIERVVEGRISPAEPELQARLKEALGAANAVRTPWFAGGIILEDQGLADWFNACVEGQVKKAWYPGPGDLVFEGVCATDTLPVQLSSPSA